MIILMVFGHAIEEFGYYGITGGIWTYIYSFHMPVFVFVSGYFSKNIDKVVANGVKDLLIPYIIFDALFAFCRYDFKITSINIFVPDYAYWYIFSLFMWRLFIKSMSKIKYIFIISVIVGLGCGFYHSFNHFLSASRTICFFPFFILGYFFSSSDIQKLKENKKPFFIILFALSGIITIALKYADIIPARMYLFDASYSSFGIENIKGVLFRVIIYITAFISILCFVNLIPNKQCFLSTIGSRTIIIYLLSSFPLKAFFSIYGKYFSLPTNWLVQIIVSIGLTIVIIAITGNSLVLKIYKQMIEKLASLFLIKETTDNNT